MNLSVDRAALASKINDFKPAEYLPERVLALYSAAITLAEPELLDSIIKIGQMYDLKRHHFYEIILQSYLFLGFPRMLLAAEHLNRLYPNNSSDTDFNKISSSESDTWFQNGTKLCQQVYKNMYEPLKENVMSIAPDIFRWMIIEGYGKVLSRDRLDIKCRELSIVAFLMMENRPNQLYSHLKGAVNVGVDSNLIKLVVDDIGQAAGDGYKTASDIIKQIGIA